MNFVEILEDKTGRSKGCAIAEFATFEGAKKCLAGLNRAEVNGRQVVAKDIRDPEAFFRKVKEETGLDFLDRRGRSGRVGGRRDGLNGGGGGAPMQDEGELYGLSPAFLRQLNITPPLCDRIFAANVSSSLILTTYIYVQRKNKIRIESQESYRGPLRASNNNTEHINNEAQIIPLGTKEFSAANMTI